MSPLKSDYDPYAYHGIDTTPDTDDSQSEEDAIQSSAAPEPHSETYAEKKKRLLEQMIKERKYTISDSSSSYKDTKEKEDKEEETQDDELTVDEYFAKYYPEEYAYGDANDGMFYPIPMHSPAPESETTSKPDDSHHTPATDDAPMDSEDAAMESSDTSQDSSETSPEDSGDDSSGSSSETEDEKSPSVYTAGTYYDPNIVDNQ